MQSLPEHAKQLLTTSDKVTKYAINILICAISLLYLNIAHLRHKAGVMIIS